MEKEETKRNDAWKLLGCVRVCVCVRARINEKEPLHWNQQLPIYPGQLILCNISRPAPGLFPFVLVKIFGCNNYVCGYLIPDYYVQANMKVLVAFLQCEKLLGMSIYAVCKGSIRIFGISRFQSHLIQSFLFPQAVYYCLIYFFVFLKIVAHHQQFSIVSRMLYWIITHFLLHFLGLCFGW